MPLSLVHALRRLDRWPRRVAALSCLVLAAATALASRSRDPAPARAAPTTTRPVVIAARALGAAHTLALRDLSTAAWPQDLVPAGTSAAPIRLVGRRLAGPVGAGEAVTATRLVGAGLTTALPPGVVAAAVRTDAAVATLIHPGDRVDVLAGPTDDDSPAGPPVGGRSTDAGAVVLAQAVAVLTVLPPTNTAGASGDAQVLIATDRGTALRIVAAQGRQVLAVVADPP